MTPITFCISTYNNLNYLKIAVESVRRNSYYTDAPFIIHAENCTDGTNEWLMENSMKYIDSRYPGELGLLPDGKRAVHVVGLPCNPECEGSSARLQLRIGFRHSAET